MIEEQKGEPKEPILRAFKHIVRRSSHEEFTFAEVEVTTYNELHRHDRHLLADLSQAITAWVKKDPEGMRWWRDETSRDANVGDLAAEFGAYGPCEALKEELEKVGIQDIWIKTFCYDSTASDWTYDTHLVNEADLED